MRDKDAVERANEKDRQKGLKEHITVDGHHETWLDMSPSEAYKEILGPAVEAYNAKQKRKDRKTTVDNEVNKYLRLSKSDTAVREIILTVGNKDEHPTDNECRRILHAQYKAFQRKNPNLKIIGVYYHADEPGAAPHLHIDYIPFHKKRNRGVDVQLGMKGALEDMGYTNVGFSTQEERNEGAMSQWSLSMHELMHEIIHNYGLETYRKSPVSKKEKDKHTSITVWKKTQLEGEITKLTRQKNKITKDIEAWQRMADEVQAEFASYCNDRGYLYTGDSCVEYTSKIKDGTATHSDLQKLVKKMSNAEKYAQTAKNYMRYVQTITDEYER